MKEVMYNMLYFILKILLTIERNIGDVLGDIN